MRWKPKTRYWRLNRVPAMNDMTRTAVGHADQATVRRKSVRAQEERNMQRVGMRQVRQKKK